MGIFSKFLAPKQDIVAREIARVHEAITQNTEAVTRLQRTINDALDQKLCNTVRRIDHRAAVAARQSVGKQ